MDNPENKNPKELARWVVIGLPIGGIIIGSFLPLGLIVRQLMIVLVLVWFQISLMFGLFMD